MLKFILVALAWFLILRKNIKVKGGILNPSSFLLIIYFISFVFAIIHILYNGIDLAYNKKYWGGAVFAFLSLYLYFLPYIKFNELKVKELKIPNLNILNLFSVFLIVVSLFSILYWLPYVSNLFLSSSDLGEMREDYVEGNLSVGGGGFFQTIAGISAHMYYFNIIIYFVYKALNIKRSQQILLLLSSVSYVIYVFSAVGRDGIVFWLFSFVCCYLFFRPYLFKSDEQVIKRLMIFAAILMLVPFMMISSSRFTGRVGGSLISYMGQALPSFCFYFGADPRPRNPGGSFPYFCDLLNIPHYHDYWSVPGTTSTSFGFFIRGFLVSLGLPGFILLELSILLLLMKNFKKIGLKMDFGKIILYFLFLQIFTQGVFYFRQYSAAGNILIIISFILFIVFSVLNNPVKIERKNV